MAGADEKARDGGPAGRADPSTTAQIEFLQSIVEHMPDGLVVADNNGRFLMFNTAARDILGIGSRDVDPSEWSKAYGCYRADGVTPYPSDKLPMVRALRGESTREVEFVIRNEHRPDGIVIRVSGRPVRDANNAIVGGIVLFRDITAEKQSVDKLAERTRELSEALEEVARLKERLEAENVLLREEVEKRRGLQPIIGHSAALRQALRRVEQVAVTDSTVLLLGETGTGKELFSHAVHARSRRRDGPLVKVDCTALPSTLIESELFGHEKGAFTDAVRSRPGRFEVADGGTLFLDEIGDLPVDLQMKLLRVLESGEFERVGSTRTRRVRVRVVAATNRDLDQMVRDGTFRSDLYYRLRVFPILIPPLRERREDIPELVEHFIESKQRVLGKRILEVPDEVLAKLRSYAWPGNVRELENVVERALITSSGPCLTLDEPLAPSSSVTDPEPDGATLAQHQRAYILEVLERCSWRIKGRGNAAERLGLPPSTLRDRMRKLGISRR